MKMLILVTVLAAAASPAAAQYKVVGPDGRVTYTDRPPAEAGSRVLPMGSRAGPPADAVLLPQELREAVGRYPVTLYTAADCAPCDTARQLLQQRGVPYTEKAIQSDDDVRALERLMGARTVPAATIGPQQLRGLNAADWNAYLDVAGYPKTSRLPRNWQPPPVTPLVAAREAPAPRRPAAPPEAPATADERAPAPGGIRF